MGLLAAALGPAVATGETVVRRLVTMGTTLEVQAAAEPREAALACSERAIRAVAAVEARLSTWRPDSELAALNAAPALRPVAVSPELAADLALVREVWGATAGAFDPAIGALVAAWDLRGMGRRPTEADLEAAVAASGMRHVEIGAGTAVRRHPGVVLEEGGFGKGVALDAAVRAAGAECRLVVDLGGQLAASPGPPRPVYLAHPDRRGEPALLCALERGSIATSGASERGIVVGGAHLGHLLDPATGAPAADFGSLSVWAATAARADCLSTGLYVLGPERALAWAAERPDVGVMVIERAGDGLRARASAGWPGEVTSVAAAIALERASSR